RARARRRAVRCEARHRHGVPDRCRGCSRRGSPGGEAGRGVGGTDMKDDVTVRDVMRTNVTFVDGNIDVMEAMRIMKRVGATSLIVEKRSERDEYGMVLFSDIAKEVIAKDRAPERVNVYEIMAKPVISVRPDMRVRYCARLFERCG